MDYNQDQYFRMQQYDTPRTPFYMSYPVQNMYLTEMEYEKDMERMKELYPREVRFLINRIDDECDKMEYEGSLMFDEYPDRMMIERIVDRIENEVNQKEIQVFEEQSVHAKHAQQRRFPKELIWVLLNDEMYRRRCRHRRCRRWW